MAPGSQPRSIVGTPGSRVRVILGETGEDYVLLLNEDDGDSQWQSHDWSDSCGSSGSSGIPYKVPRQIQNCVDKDRYITAIDFNATTGAWYMRGVKRDGTGEHAWWGSISDDASEAIKEASEEKVSLGCVCDRYNDEEETYAVIEGSNGFSLSGNISKSLEKRIRRIHRQGLGIKFVRLFDHGGYFISDDEGTEWCGLGDHASKELRKNAGTGVCEVAVAKDGSWIIIRDLTFVSSTGVSDKLDRRLKTFYAQQKSRYATRQREIRDYVSRELDRVAREAADRERAEQQAREEQERLAREAAIRENERQQILESARVWELKEECMQIQALENFISERKQVVLSSLKSLPLGQRDLLKVANSWNVPCSSSKSECVICHDEEAQRALVPCGHHCLCDECSTQLMTATRKCPLCREHVQSTLKIYSQS